MLYCVVNSKKPIPNSIGWWELYKAFSLNRFMYRCFAPYSIEKWFKEVTKGTKPGLVSLDSIYSYQTDNNIIYNSLIGSESIYFDSYRNPKTGLYTIIKRSRPKPSLSTIKDGEALFYPELIWAVSSYKFTGILKAYCNDAILSEFKKLYDDSNPSDICF